jgi:hypothetical protein
MRRELVLAFGLMTGMASAAEDAVVPFTVQQISGSRPIVTIAVNGHDYPAIVHSNAGLFLQINHAQAAAVGVKDLKHKDSFGIEAPGKVSALGRDTGTVERLAVGGVEDRDAPVEVFEKPADVTMLGLGWIKAHGIIVDFANGKIVVPGGAETPKRIGALLKEGGYSAHAMRRDPVDGRYLVTVSINGAKADMVVSTVVDGTVDTAFAARAGVRPGRVVGNYGGPSGATGEEYESAEPVTVVIDGWHSQSQKLTIEDTYAYVKQARPADARGGMLGADFLIAHGAVVDFGTMTLYLR